MQQRLADLERRCAEHAVRENSDDPKGRIEELAARNLKEVVRNPCEVWDSMVEAQMARYGCARSIAVDRCLAVPGGSSAWAGCCAWDAQQPKILSDGSKSGNWLNQGNGIARRVPRQP